MLILFLLNNLHGEDILFDGFVTSKFLQIFKAVLGLKQTIFVPKERPFLDGDELLLDFEAEVFVEFVDVVVKLSVLTFDSAQATVRKGIGVFHNYSIL